MIRKSISLVLCILLILSCFAGCGSNGTDKQLVFPIDSEPEYLDPQIVSDVGAKSIVANCFEGLVAFDENGEIVPAAAKSWVVSDDGLTYTFTLRDDLRWLLANAAKNMLGEEKANSFDNNLVADDFVFGITRALLPETKSPYAENLMAIKNAKQVNSGKLYEKQLGVSAPDEHTFVITLERPDSDLLMTLTAPACMPCDEEFFNWTKGRYGLSNAYMIYNGPFYISNWAEKTAITARKNGAYHGDLQEDGKTWVSKEPAKPSSIYYSFNNEQATRGRKIKDGTYDVALLTASQAKELSENSKYTIRQFDNAVFSLVFNCADEVMSNMNVRRAIGQSFNHETVLSAVEKQSAGGIVPSAMQTAGESYRKNAAAFESNTLKNKKAVSLLKSGLDELDKKDIELKILCETEHENTVRALMQQWQSLFGVVFSVSVEAVDAIELQNKIASGEYQIALTDVKYNESSAFNCVSRYTSDSKDNFTSLNQKQYDSIIKKYRKAKNAAEKRKIIEEAEAYLISCSVIIPICESETYYGIGKGVEGITFSPSGDIVYFKNGIRK